MRHTALIIPLLLGLPLLGSGCRNACQALCREMYDYALECGHSVTKEDLRACYQAETTSLQPRTKRQDCREGFDDLRLEWDCDDLVRYFNGTGGSEPEDTGASDSYCF